jgi:PiT family inorganic phosphate transporter
VAVFSFIGAMLQGGAVMKTIGKGIVKQDLDYIAVFVTLATFYRIPTSTSQAIIGGVLGIGLAVRAEIDYSKLGTIAESWLICPLLVMVLAFCLYHLLNFILQRINKSQLLVHNTLG